MKLTELDQIARQHLFRKGQNTLHGYVRVMLFLVDFLKKFSMNHTYMDRPVILQVDEKNCIQLPEDFISFNSVGWQSGDRLIKFERDNSIALNHSYAEDIASATQNVSYSIFESFPYNSDVLSESFSTQQSQPVTQGLGHNGSGYFKFNYAAGEIQFSTDAKVSGGVYLSYKSNGFNPTTKSTIPEFAVDVAEAYVRWQEARFDRRMGDAAIETQARKAYYYMAYDELLTQQDPIDYETLVGIQAQAFDFNKLAR